MLFNKRQNSINLRSKQDNLALDRESEIKILKKRISYNAKNYHNGVSIVADEFYDRDIDRLRELSPDDELLKRVGAKVRGAKVQLPFPMGSLDKYRNKDFDNLRATKRGSHIIISDKLDGSSALIVNSGKELKLYSRGNGLYGQDISSLLYIIGGIGEIKQGEAVRGELVISKKLFTSKFSKSFENARNLVSGVVNSKDRKANPAANNITFIAHEFIKPALKAEQGFSLLKSRGFKVSNFKKFPFKTSVEELDKYVKERKAKSEFDLDGIVIEFNDGYRTSYKLDDPAVSARVKEVIWQVSKTGILKPVVIFDKPVRLSGASVTKVTGVNARFIMNNGIGNGAIILVIRAGDVIPKIVGVSKPVTPEFPENAIWDTNKVEAIVNKKTQNKEQFNKQKAVSLSEAFKILAIPNFRAQMAIKLVESKIDSLDKVILSETEDFIKAGFGPRQAQQLYTEFKEALKRVDHPKMMWASGVFPRGFALSKFSTLLESYTYSGIKNMSIAKRIRLFSELPSFSNKSANDLALNFDKYVEFIETIGWKPNARTNTGLKESSVRTLGGKVFVFTGFRDSSLEKQIEIRGGKISNTVTKLTTAVIAMDLRKKSTKIDKAKSYNIPVMSINSFRDSYINKG